MGDGETPDDQALPHPVTGIGVSAEGVEACIELFRNLAPDTGMAFVLIPQFAADLQSYLVETLGRCTPMPVAGVSEASGLQPDRVYVLPSALPRPIDPFLGSLAESRKSRAVGIVLSGTHGDGALGLRAIKSEGGIAILQTSDGTGPAGPAEHWRNSIPLDYVDRILPPDQIAVELGQIGRRFQEAGLRALQEGSLQPGGEIPYSRILDLLKGVSGVDFRLYKPAVIRRRIARRMLLRQIRSLDEYAAFLQGNATELADLQQDALIGETQFFRDSPVFAALADTILPRIFTNRNTRQAVRIWVAGCSSGEEVYSIAICLLEYLAGRPFDAPVQIFGTDASEHAIQTARMGIFPESVAEEISPERLQRFFVRVPEGYQIAQQVRTLCIFARHNLCHDPPFSRMDLVSCRNVLTYLEPELQTQILGTLHYALRPDGFLLLGVAEKSRAPAGLFQLLDHRHKIFAKVGDGLSRANMAAAPRPRPANAPPPSAGKWVDKELRRAADRIVLARYAPPGVVVDEEMRILQSRGHTSPFLEIPQGKVSWHLARMLRESIAAPVTNAVERAVEQDLPVRVEGLRVPVVDQIREITLEVLPIRTVAPRSRCFLVLFAPSREPAPDGSLESRESPETHGQDELAERLRQDLALTKLHLQTLLEERDVRNRELILANQEVQSADHAVRRANQELAEIKDQLQRAEEVLRTVGDLQQRNATLVEAVNDLSNLLNSANLPMLTVGSDLGIRQFTALTQKVLNLRPQDIGRPVTDVRLNLRTAGMELLFREVLETLTPREAEVQDSEGRWYLMRARPYRTADNRIEGVVVVLVDIDQLRRSQQELLAARDFAGALIESLPTPLAVIDSGFRIRVANDAFRSLATLGKGDVDGRSFPDLAWALWGLREPLRTHLQNLRESRNAGGRFRFEHEAPGEKPRVLDIRGCGLASDGETSLLVTIEDITAHKDVERSLALDGARLAREVASTARELGRTQDELRALAASLFTSQEQERRRVARELHDDISQKLALLEIDAQQVEPQIASDPERARHELERVRAAIGDLSEEVRRISHALHPSVIEDLGVGPAIRSLVEDFRDRERMIVTFRCQDIPDGIPLEIATGLYRITQEALRNVAKHAGKTHVKVSLEGTSGRIRLQVIDAGAGFDVQARGSGLGLISTAERVRIMQGTLTIESELGEGTRVTVDVPWA